MNTKIDETLLARWLEDDLAGAEQTAVEAGLAGDAGLLALRETTRAIRRDLGALLPAIADPPYPEFFNRRLADAIRRPGAGGGVVAGPGWGRWWVPLGAAAGMAVAFWAGMLSGPERQVVAQQPQPAEVLKVVNEPGLYTPERGVDAEWFASEEAAATVIVLSGVDAIPDDMDFSTTTAGMSGGDGTQVLVGTHQEQEGDRQ